MKKRWISVLLAIAMLAGLLSMNGLAAEQNRSGRTGSSDFSLFEPTADEGEITQVDPFSSASSTADTSLASATYSSSSYYSSTGEAAEYIRAQMVSRVESITICYMFSYSSTSQIRSAISEAGTEILTIALEHTGVPDEGDSLLWQYGSYHFTAGFSISDGVCYVTYAYTFTYYTTLAEEQELDEAVEALLSDLGLLDSEKTDYEKVWIIYDYICQNVKYDYSRMYDTISHTAYAALVEGRAVCQGYALLFYRLCLETGVDARLISGTSGGVAHGWNIVAINGIYYYVDCTWDAGADEYSYFLCGSTTFSQTHQVDSQSSDIVDSYLIYSADYDPDAIIFTDVLDDSVYYYNAVYWAAEEGITTGTTATTFSPDNEITRAQLVTFLYRLAGEPSVSGLTNPFTDVTEAAYTSYYDAILWAYSEEITTGKNLTTTFCPDDIVTRGEIVTFLYRYYDEPSVSGLENEFTDVADGLYYTDAILWAYNAGITTGTSVSPLCFSPSNVCTRAQFVTLLYRAETGT